MGKMNHEVKEKWLEALRSGKYLQGRTQLKQDTTDGTRYCCLGVLCEIAVQEGVIQPSYFSSPEWYYDGNSRTLPLSVTNWSNVSGKGSYLSDRDEERLCLTYLNDWTKKTFTEIADVIEEYL